MTRADSPAALAACRVEVARCRRNLAQGGDPAFWRRRLRFAAQNLERGARLLRDQIDAIDLAEARARIAEGAS